jgi:F-type H+-transporting ATPase subunit b
MKTLVTPARLPRVLLVAPIVVATLVTGGDPAVAAEGGLPQFDSAFFLTQLFWLALIFGTFYLLVQGVAIPAVVRVLDARDGKIAYDITRAEEKRNEAAALAAMIDDKIIHARDHARTILSLANREAESVATARLAMFDARIAGQVRDAERRVGHARDTALKELPALAGALIQEVVVRLGETTAECSQVSSAIEATLNEPV